MVGTKVKQINNLVITQKDRGYYVWAPNGSLLYQSTVLKDVEQKCSACKTYLQKQNSNKISSVDIKQMLYKQAQSIFSNYTAIDVDSAEITYDDGEFFSIWVKHPKSELYWEIGFETNPKNPTLGGRVNCVDEEYDSLYLKDFSIPTSKITDSNYMRELWMKIKKIVDTAMPNKVMYYAKTILTNVRPLINNYYLTIPIRGIGTFNHVTTDADLLKRKYGIKYGYRMYTHLTETTLMEILVDFFEKDNEIKCGIHFSRSNKIKKEEDGYSLIVNVDTHNIPRFTQSLAKKLNKIAYEETLCFRESIKEFLDSGHPAYSDTVRRIKKEQEMKNKAV